MMPLCWSMLLLCLSANAAENVAVYREPGENITLRCSFAGCPSDSECYGGMYLYHEFKKKEEVLYYFSKSGSKDRITPRQRYSNRIQTNGPLKNHTITISNLTVDDSGFYTCVYNAISINGDQCDVYFLVVREVPTCYRSAEVTSAPANEKTLPVVLIIITTGSISILVTIICILLIVPRMKQSTSSRRRVPQVSNDNVYEVMSKNNLRSPAAPEQSPLSPCDFA